MTQPYDYDDDPQNDLDGDDQPEEKYARIPRKQIRSLEKRAKDYDAAQERIAALERRIALSDAGVSGLSERQQKALLATLDGDITAESVRTAAEELGFVQPAPDAPAAQEQQAMDRMSQASAGATDPGSEDSVAALERAAQEGPEAFYAQLAKDGHVVGSPG